MTLINMSCKFSKPMNTCKLQVSQVFILEIKFPNICCPELQSYSAIQEMGLWGVLRRQGDFRERGHKCHSACGVGLLPVTIHRMQACLPRHPDYILNHQHLQTDVHVMCNAKQLGSLL